MIIIKRVLTIYLMSLLVSTAMASKELEIGAAAPKVNVKMMDISDKMISLSEARKDNGLLVIFSCNTCPYVIASEDRYKAAAALAAENNVGVVLINSNEAQRDGVDSLEEMKKHAKKYEYQFYYTVDAKSEIADAFGATRTPHIFLFDKTMKLVYRGAIDDSVMDANKVEKRYLANAIEALASGTEIDVKTTRSIGCTIKRK